MTTAITTLVFAAGEQAILAASGTTPATLVTIVGTKGRWVQVRANFLPAESEPVNVARNKLSPVAEIPAERIEAAEALAGLVEASSPLERAVKLDLLNSHGLLVDGDLQVEVTTGYAGPMLALRQRLLQGAYSKAVNGQPCCGDVVAIKLGTLTPAQVIRACIVAMNLPNNPYTHLNIGQQSMNLRNKLRGCMKRGEFGFGVVVEAVEQVEEESAAATSEA